MNLVIKTRARPDKAIDSATISSGGSLGNQRREPLYRGRSSSQACVTASYPLILFASHAEPGLDSSSCQVKAALVSIREGGVLNQIVAKFFVLFVVISSFVSTITV